MLDLYLLNQFLEVATSETLSTAAEHLHISQPALSKAMRRLEEDLNMPLFHRSKNKITLNETGQYFVPLVKDLLAREEAMLNDLKAFDEAQRKIRVGVCAPIMLRLMDDYLKQFYPDKLIETEMVSDEALQEGIKKDTYQLIVTHEPVPELVCKICGDEQLYVSLPKIHPLCFQEDITFSDLNGLTFLRMQNVGFWNERVNALMPDSKFILQSDRQAFYDIAEASTLPTFTSDYFLSRNVVINTNVTKPIADDEAYTAYYLCTKKTDQRRYQSLFDSISILTFK